MTLLPSLPCTCPTFLIADRAGKSLRAAHSPLNPFMSCKANATYSVHARNFRSPEAAIQKDLLSHTRHVLLCTTVTNIMMLNSSESVLAM